MTAPCLHGISAEQHGVRPLPFKNRDSITALQHDVCKHGQLLCTRPRTCKAAEPTTLSTTSQASARRKAALTRYGMLVCLRPHGPMRFSNSIFRSQFLGPDPESPLSLWEMRSQTTSCSQMAGKAAERSSQLLESTRISERPASALIHSSSCPDA